MATYGHYSDNQDPYAAYNPYDSAEPHQSYDQGGYHDAGGYGAGYRDDPSVGNVAATKEEGDRSVFEASSPTVERSLEPKTAKAMRRWRYEHQGNLWKRGGGGRCFGRFFCCTLMTVVFLFLSIVMSLALWINPPNVIVSDVSLPSDGSAVQITPGPGVNVNVGVNISVANPNYFSVKFNEIKVDVFYPINNTHIGGGSIKDVNIKSNAETNFTLPFALNYTETEDPNFSVLQDIAGHCGFLPGGTQGDLSVNYKISLDFHVLFVPIKPTISNQFKFACPFTAQQVGDLLKSAGLDGLIGLLVKMA
ncbi:hypothetical protein EIP91_003985 [Steccherinum ochraceum]|uniref:Late embryogenesis abundant protein LEA-2 subgroup domain-containing protein n=1 Tax=Steccherinum ochraceum TaxID=92696 RepID=A0A4V2MW23_9APHY|nr:hypothetical protein EIP91_003985 [Steccherinum ochraceum]